MYGIIRHMGTHKVFRIIIALRLSTRAGQRTLQGIFRYISSKRLHWDIRLKRDSDEFGLVNVNRFPQWNIDGIIFGMTAPDKRLDASIRAIAHQRAPIVAIDVRDQPVLDNRQNGIAFVNTDTVSVGQTAAAFLVGHGTYRSYGYVADSCNRSWSVLRGKAYAEAIAKRGFSCAFYRPATLEKDDFAELCAWLKGLTKPAALFVAFDDRAVTVLEACRMLDYRVPEDIAILGVDDDELVDEHTDPPLSSIHPDHERQGFLAAERLHALLSGRTNVERQTFVPIQKVSLRGTTSATADAGTLVQKALAFIDANFDKGIDPTAVANELRISRRLLDLRFHDVVGTTVTQTIRARQLDEVRRRLTHTSDSIEKISFDCGFANSTYLKELFKKRFNSTMSRYRHRETAD